MQTISVPTRQRNQMLDVTEQVHRTVRDALLENGYVICYVPHTTAGITIQENADPDVVHDVLWKLEQLVPRDDRPYQHSEGNSDSHIKASMMGSSVTVLVEVTLQEMYRDGTYQKIYNANFGVGNPLNVLVWPGASTLFGVKTSG